MKSSALNGTLTTILLGTAILGLQVFAIPAESQVKVDFDTPGDNFSVEAQVIAPEISGRGVPCPRPALDALAHIPKDEQVRDMFGAFLVLIGNCKEKSEVFPSGCRRMALEVDGQVLALENEPSSQVNTEDGKVLVLNLILTRTALQLISSARQISVSACEEKWPLQDAELAQLLLFSNKALDLGQSPFHRALHEAARRQMEQEKRACSQEEIASMSLRGFTEKQIEAVCESRQRQ